MLALHKASHEISMADNGWGDVIESSCPNTHYLCGIKARHERNKNVNDSQNRQWATGVNGLWLKCCPFG